MAHKRNIPTSSLPLAAFGAALSAIAVTHVPPAHAAIVDLTAVPTTNPFRTGFAGAYVALQTLGAATVFSFYQNNDNFGKTLDANFAGGSFINTDASVTLTAGDSHFGLSLRVLPGSGGIYTVGFKTALNQVGWLRMNLGGAGLDIVYLAAAFNNTPGGSIHVGTGAQPIPEPSTGVLAGLGMLAAGATGVIRQRRTAKAKQATEAA